MIGSRPAAARNSWLAEAKMNLNAMRTSMARESCHPLNCLCFNSLYSAMFRKSDAVKLAVPPDRRIDPANPMWIAGWIYLTALISVSWR